uniref:Uncharacterized protein n=1 Tax=Anopheles christyi TaxID=43041 RepID=A0A182KIY7_9DIPT
MVSRPPSACARTGHSCRGTLSSVPSPCGPGTSRSRTRSAAPHSTDTDGLAQTSC